MSENGCYVLQIFEIVENSQSWTRTPAREFRGQPRSVPPASGLCSFIENGQTVVDWDLFVCRSFEKARELMLDGGLLSVDWYSCHEENDSFET
ncbi:MAG TPA: hypothetical protein ENN89_00585, partial [Synergistetes bacterium]|nr:hypothetical protein [Synergistota bacterium]